VKELERPLAQPRAEGINRAALAKKAALVLGVLALVGFLVSRLNLARDLHRLDARILSGGKEGNYYAIVDDLGKFAQTEHGTITNIATNGTAENIARLKANKCDDAQFALVQDGGDFKGLRLIARLWKAESVFFLGKDADKYGALSTAMHAKVGIGPDGSGGAVVAKALLDMPELKPLGIETSFHPMQEQMDMAARGDLDLVVVVMDEDAPFIVNAIRDRGLQIAGFQHLDVVSRRLPHFKTGRIGAGQFDPVRVIPAEDKRVLRVETLVLANDCASRSTIIDLWSVMAQKFPELLQHDKTTPNTTGLAMAPAAKGFLEHDGPELADELAPWLVDVMPPANWAYVVMAVSILFNAMGAGHRFRLWRIDDARVKLENELSELFDPGSTLGDITRTDPDERHRTAAGKTTLDSLIKRFEALADRSRRQSLSMLVPMGQEMAYRYQEGVIYDTLAVLRAFRSRVASVK
jgi:TRAP-type uncharacterized transport system substrate-binding protein